MSPAIHLFSSWIVAAKTTDNLRDRRLVTLAGIVPDADGLGLAIDLITRHLGLEETTLYESYHHYLLHGVFAAVAFALLAAVLARHKGRVVLLAFALFHLHLACDVVAGRGPSPEDLWAVHYLGPMARDPAWVWQGQWPLFAWENRWISVALFAWCLYLAVKHGDSFVGVFNRRLDAGFVAVLRKWFHWTSGEGSARK